MSVKCKPSAMYLPLIKQLQSEAIAEATSANLNDPILEANSANELWKLGLFEYFTDVDEALNLLPEEEKVIPINVDPSSIQAISEGNNNEIISDKSWLANNPTQAADIKSSFTKSILKFCLFDLDTGQFVQEQNINLKIFDWKLSLLKQINEITKLPIDLNNLDLNNNDEIELAFETILNEASTLPDDSLENILARKNAILLTNFDSYIKSLASYIKIKNSSINSYQHIVNKYEYIGPSVQHYTGFSNDESASIESNISDLAKQLLNYFPYLDDNEQQIGHNTIGVAHYNALGTKFKKWLYITYKNEDFPELIEDLADEQLIYAFDRYSDYCNKTTAKRLVSPKGVINSLKKYVFNENADIRLRNLFSALMTKTQNYTYVSYKANSRNSEDNGKTILTSRPLIIERKQWEDKIRSAIVYWKPKKNILNSKLQEFNLKADKTLEIGLSTLSEAQIDELISQVFNLSLDTSFNEVAKYATSTKEKNPKIAWFSSLLSKVYPVIFDDNRSADSLTFISGEEFALLQSISLTTSSINGTDVGNVVKNDSGNNIPLYQLSSYAYKFRKLTNKLNELEHFNLENDLPSTVSEENSVYINRDSIQDPLVRAEVVSIIDGETVIKSPSELTADEVMHIAILDDFYGGLTASKSYEEEASGKKVVGFQPATFADKNTHFIAQFELQSWKHEEGIFNFEKDLLDYIKFGDSSKLVNLKKVWRESNFKQYENAINKIYYDYAEVYGWEDNLSSKLKLEKIKSKIKSSSKEIRKDFKSEGVEFVEEFHMSKNTFNETIELLYNAFSSEENFNKYINLQLQYFIEDSQNVWNTIQKERAIFIDAANIKDKKHPWANWVQEYSYKDEEGNTVNSYKITLTDVNGELNPLMSAYFYASSFFGNEYNKFMSGEVYAHPNKYKGNSSDSRYSEYSFSSRYIAQIKREVIHGATVHPLLQNRKNGVPKNIKMAVIKDMGSYVNNYTGNTDKVDSQDGAGFTSSIYSRLQNNSLVDASVGPNKKTIYADMDYTTGIPKLLKWAEYEITNAVRRNSWGSTASMQNMWLKMHSIPFTTSINYDKLIGNIYIYDPELNLYFLISNFSIENGFAKYTFTEVDIYGNIIQEHGEMSTKVNSLAEIDQIFGSGWSMEMGDNGELVDSEISQDILTDIVIENDEKESFIGYLVNTSAIKVGASNVNSEDSWYDDSKLMTTIMSTEYGGVQMDADHHLDKSDSTESSQMLSALVQNGFTQNLAQKVYEDIGAVCVEAIEKVSGVLNNPVELYDVFGKAVIKSFQTNDRETIGLAQSFVDLAIKEYSTKTGNNKLPFSAKTLNGIFASTVTSSLVRDIIRRHYNGVAAVLNPSFNFMQIYNIDGIPMLYPEYIRYINKNGSEELIVDFDKTQMELQSEDTIILENGSEVKIDSFEKYDYYNNYYSGKLKIDKSKPRNLQGANTKFTLNGKEYSVFNSDLNRKLFILQELKNKKFSSKKDFISAWSEKIKELYEDFNDSDNIIKESLKLISDITDEKISVNKLIVKYKKEQQNFLNSLSDNVDIISWNGKEYNKSEFSDIKVVPAQIIMGKLFAKEFNLKAGDSIREIKQQGSQFFYKRLVANYNLSELSKIADQTLFTGTGDSLYVMSEETFKSLNDSDLKLNKNYEIIDEKVYYNDIEISSAEGKEFYTYTIGETTYNIVKVSNLDRGKELLNSSMFTTSYDNYTLKNYKELLFVNYGYIPGEDVITESQKQGFELFQSAFANTQTPEEALNNINQLKYNQWLRKLNKLAENQFSAFLKSLNFIGTRIPCQSQQQVMALEIVAFTDSEINEVYVPTNQTWLHGSD